MQITLDNTKLEVFEGETILEAARRIGKDIPSLCYAKGAKHKSSCMVCAVKDCSSGQIIPSCTSYPIEGMNIETDSEEVKLTRKLSLELLISDHRADCEAPCTMVCPYSLDIEKMLYYYDAGRHQEAFLLISGAFPLPALGCENCKVPCEKVCRMGTVDETVAIRAIIKEVVSIINGSVNVKTGEVKKDDKEIFHSRLGRFTTQEKEILKETTSVPSRCLHCACAGSEGCKLRLYATNEGIKRTRYGLGSALPAMQKIHLTGKLWYEPAKCIRCGLCVYNTKNGFTFKDRGFIMQVLLPEENRKNISEDIAELCPTGALYLVDN